MPTDQQKLKMTIEQFENRSRSGSMEPSQAIVDPQLSRKQPTKKTISSREIEPLQIDPSHQKIFNAETNELEKIQEIQRARGRSASMMVTMNASPAAKSIKNFGHSVKSNLVAKAKQIQQVRQRSQSIQVNDVQAHHTFLLAHLQ